MLEWGEPHGTGSWEEGLFNGTRLAGSKLGLHDQGCPHGGGATGRI